MKFNRLTTNGKHLQIAAFGYGKFVSPDQRDVREAIRMADYTRSSFNADAKALMAFSVFVKAAMVVRFTKDDMLACLASTRIGEAVIMEFARSKLGLIESVASKMGRRP